MHFPAILAVVARMVVWGVEGEVRSLLEGVNPPVKGGSRMFNGENFAILYYKLCIVNGIKLLYNTVPHL